MKNPFFQILSPISLSEIAEILKIEINVNANSEVNDIRDLASAENKNIR